MGADLAQARLVLSRRAFCAASFCLDQDHVEKVKPFQPFHFRRAAVLTDCDEVYYPSGFSTLGAEEIDELLSAFVSLRKCLCQGVGHGGRALGALRGFHSLFGCHWHL